MVVFVHDLDTDELINVVYEVVEIRTEIYNNMYVLRVCDVISNNVKYFSREKYYLKVV